MTDTIAIDAAYERAIAARDAYLHAKENGSPRTSELGRMWMEELLTFMTLTSAWFASKAQ